MLSRTPIFVVSSLLILAACGGSGSAPSADSKPDSGSAESSAAATIDPNTGKITGSVKFTGAKPANKKISMGADAYCKGAHTTAVFAEEVVVNANSTLKNVYVYVKSGLEGKSFGNASGSVLLNQVGCVYTPHVIAVQTNQDVVIKNSDNVLHNVNARPKNNKGFNVGQPVKGMETKKTICQSRSGHPR